MLRNAVLFVVALGAVLAAAAAVLSLRGDDPAEGSAHYERTFPAEYVGTVWFTVDADDGVRRRVTATWTRLQREFDHRGGGATTYLVVKGAGKERSAPLMVDVDPPAPVTFSFGKAPPDGVDLSETPWEVLPYDAGVAEPRPATVDSPTAWAAVDESVSYGGVDATGTGVRPEPHLDAARSGVVHHGEVYALTCWRVGERLTNGNDADPADDAAAYTSDVWWQVETPQGTGLVPDVWLARRGNSDRLNLPPCA